MKFIKTIIILMSLFLTSDTCISKEYIQYKRIYDSTVLIERNMPPKTYTLIIFESNDEECVKRIYLKNISSFDVIKETMNRFVENKEFKMVIDECVYCGTYSLNKYGEKTLFFSSNVGVFEVTERDINKISKYFEKRG